MTAPAPTAVPAYAELHCLSNFTFLRGASHPEEVVARAAALGYRALALTDECSVAGVVRAHTAAREQGIQLIIGTELHLADGLRCVLLAANQRGYEELCELITRGRRAATKGSYQLVTADLQAVGLADCLALWLPESASAPVPPGFPALQQLMGQRLWLAVELHARGDDRRRCAALQALAAQLGLPAVASGDVHMHRRSRRALQDTVTAIRLGLPLGSSSAPLHANGERHLRTTGELAALYPAELLTESVAIAGRIRFSLEELRYQYPRELVPAGHTPASYLRACTLEGAARRWPPAPSSGAAGGDTVHAAPPAVMQQIEKELALISELHYEPYFLTVADIVRFARHRGILCQGRGSAANSAVCFCLGITEVDPARMAMLFERFISRERNEPPDIDVDFEHERREEVIQYLYTRYGRDRAALAATVITYSPRSAIRDVGRALGLSAEQVGPMARAMQWWDGREVKPERVREAGLDPETPVIRRLLLLVQQLLGFPRHLSQHVGGFVISAGPLSRLVPVENAAMPGRTVIQWDKNDLDALGLLKVDVLALGMLSAIRRCFDLLRQHGGPDLTLHSVPPEDPAVYRMISAADTVGVFQIESRAQMAMLPRLRPCCYYDLVIEVALIRPGPIQGDMVHPYLRRRHGIEPVSYPSPAVREVLARTLGVPIFQEQVMQLAVVAAGFTPGEADQLRRAMAAWQRRGTLGPFEERLLAGMAARGYAPEFARQICNQIRGFGEYGFPESHAASFALLVYVSAWLKCHHPAAFTAALLNSQPMGFYGPSQLLQSAQRQGVTVRGVDVLHSGYHCTLEHPGIAGPLPLRLVLRLGLRLVQGLSAAGAAALLAAREQRAFASIQDLQERSGLDARDLGALAAAGALASLAGHRHRARWEVAGVESSLPVFPVLRVAEAAPLLRAPTVAQDVVADYRSLGLSLGPHPMALLRPRLLARGVKRSDELWDLPDGAHAHTAALVITRQRPGSAAGVIFATLEDECGPVNLIVWQGVWERHRQAMLGARLLAVWGQIQREGDVLHLVPRRLADWSALLGDLTVASRDFC
jgi:error-prone DNA polymerase